MKQQIQQLLAASMLVFSFMALPAMLASDTASAAPRGEVCKGIDAIGGGNACTDAAQGNQLSGFIQDIINILLFIIGAVAVIMIIIGGIRYTTSNGDQSQVTAAKNTILYAVVGLVVAIMAYAIVNFVIDQL